MSASEDSKLPRWPADGGFIDRIDQRLSSPFFSLRLGYPLELALSVPGCIFGMPASGAPLGLLLALVPRRVWPERLILPHRPPAAN